LFPIAPLTGVREGDTMSGSLADITCDSDGRVRDFVGRSPAADGGGRLLGIFLTGAYQEALGSTHNLFGRTTRISVATDATSPGGFRLTRDSDGDTAATVLSDLEYDPQEMAATVAAALQAAGAADADTLAAEYRRCLADTTYLSSGG
jgi:arginine decarboxylase